MGKLHNLPLGGQEVCPRSEQQTLFLASISKSCSHSGHFSTSCSWRHSPHLWPCLLPPGTGPLICISLHSNKSNYLFQWLPVLWNYEAMIDLPGNSCRGPAGNVLMVAALNKLCASKPALILTETAPICSRELQNSYPILVLKFFIIFVSPYVKPERRSKQYVGRQVTYNSTSCLSSERRVIAILFALLLA